jgi:hypothetical protein
MWSHHLSVSNTDSYAAWVLLKPRYISAICNLPLGGGPDVKANIKIYIIIIIIIIIITLLQLGVHPVAVYMYMNKIFQMSKS